MATKRSTTTRTSATPSTKKRTTRSTVAKKPAIPAKKAPIAKKAASPTATKPAAPATIPHEKVKHKLVRDSFTIPKAEYLVIDALKHRAAELKRPVKKSELLRAGIAVLKAMPDAAFLAALAAVPSLKTGRPAKSR